MNKLYHIGCSGYYYPSWKNKFYPAGLQPKNWLAYYCTVFNTVELNGTFYRVPTIEALKKYAATTLADFKFSVKMNKSITHVLKLKKSKPFITDFQDLIQKGLENKLAHFLFQLPPSFHYNDENLEQVLTNIPHTAKNVVEFRHVSWWNDTVKKSFSEVNLTFCNVDFPGIKSSFIHTSPVFYLRLHGNPELFKSSYSKAQLEKFYTQFPGQCKDNSIYFNNTFYEAGYTNAVQLIEIVKSNK
jgi:uncharacterized protein YecE (DUF72 family)